MPSITSIQLRERVAEHLKIKAADIELDAINAAKIDRVIDDAFEELRERGLCWWPDDAIPQSCAFALTLIVSSQACVGCGKAEQGYEAGDADGRTRLSILKQSANIETLQADYF